MSDLPAEKQEETTVPLSQVTSRVEEIFGKGNDAATAKVVDLLVRNKPMSFGARSVAPYYKEKYAKAIRKVLDDIEKDKLPKLFEYKVYCSDGRMSPSTLYSKINYAIRYLLCEMDTADLHYKRLMEQVEVKKKHGVGIVIQYRQSELEPEVPLVAESVLPEAETPKWKDELDTWLETSNVGDKYYQGNLMLSPAEIIELNTSLSQVRNVIRHITSREIKLMKVNI